LKIPGKRIKGLSPDMASDDAARAVLGLRFEAVRMLAPLAAHEWEKDVEHVHQLRVSTRRAASAMSAFKPCLKKKRAKKARSLLKTLRSAAGPARDADVHLAIFRSLLAETEGDERVAVERAIESIRAERDRVQPALTSTIDAHPAKELEKRFERLLDSIDAPKELPTLGTLATHALVPLAEALRETASVTPWTTSRLHAIRIDAKKLRYACEVFECCLDEATATEFRDSFVPLVGALGDLNDSDNMVARLASAGQDDAELAGLRDAPTAGVRALQARFEADLSRRKAASIEALTTMLASHFLARLTGRPTEMARSA